MSGRVDFDMSTGTGVLYESQAVVTTSLTAPGAKPTNPKPRNILSGKLYADWGATNNFPQDLIDKVSKNTVAPSALQFKIKTMYGKGIQPVLVDMDANGKEVLTKVDDPKVNEFFAQNDIRKYLRESITDYVWFGNIFPEVVLNKRGNRIVRLYSNESAYCRWGKIDQTSGRIEKCYVSANWPTPRKEEVVEVAVADPYDPIASIRDGSAFKYILPVSCPSPGKSYYQTAQWHGAYSNGWIDVANEIPVFKKALFKNQMSIKYHVSIPYDYWDKKFRETGKTLNEEEKKAIITTELQTLNDFLRGTENAGKAFISHFGTDPVNKRELPGWKIEVLDDKAKDGKWLPDSAAANSEILFAMQVDPSLMGAGMPGGVYSGSSGSGSDKRESFLIQIALMQADRDTILEPLHIIRDFNGWDSNIQFRFIDTILTTLDKGKGTEKVLG